MNDYISDRRFYGDITAAQAIEWIKTHDYVWYQGPMDHGVHRVYLTSKLKLWKRSPERFQVSGELNNYGERFTIDNAHLDRLRLPFPLWHHGISATVSHVRYIGASARQIVLHQSNGFHLHFDRLANAISFAIRARMELTVRYGQRTRVLVSAHPAISGERTF